MSTARAPCKTVGSAYVGSNPTPATTQKPQVTGRFAVAVAELPAAVRHTAAWP